MSNKNPKLVLTHLRLNTEKKIEKSLTRPVQVPLYIRIK